MRITALAVAALLLLSAAAEAGTISFTGNFRKDLTVDISASGTKATFKQDDKRTAPYWVELINDPSAGDPAVIVGGNGSLIFDYDLYQLSPGNTEDFVAVLLSGSTGVPVGAPYQFKAFMASQGTVSWDLSALTGKTLGVAFYMRVHSDSEPSSGHLVVSNLHRTPAPAAFLSGLALLGTGLLFRVLRRKRS